jgi:calcineurin-like phosphoesterase
MTESCRRAQALKLGCKHARYESRADRSQKRTTRSPLNALGRLFIELVEDPFGRIAADLDDNPLGRTVQATIVDCHCEATGEKHAARHFCDGRASLVVGTHTQTPSADDRILPGRTAFITDIGMTGDYNSIVGMAREESLPAVRQPDQGGATPHGN